MSTKDTWTYADHALLIGFLALGEDFPSVAKLIGKSEAQIRKCWSEVSGLLAADLSAGSVPKSVAPKHLRERPQTVPALIKTEGQKPSQNPPQKPLLKKWEPRKFRVSPFARSLAQSGPRDVTAMLMGDPSAAQIERCLATSVEPKPSSHHTKWS